MHPYSNKVMKMLDDVALEIYKDGEGSHGYDRQTSYENAAEFFKMMAKDAERGALESNNFIREYNENK